MFAALRGPAHRPGRRIKHVSVTTTLALVAGLVSAAVWATPAQAAGERIALAKTATGSVLPGEPVS